MHVRKVELTHVRIPLRSPFAHAAHERWESNAVIVTLTDDEGRTGLGEIQPRSYVTGETIETATKEHGPAMARAWLGRHIDDANDLLDVIRGARALAGPALATLSGFELAAIDLAGKAFGFEAGEMIGPVVDDALPEPGIVIGFEVESDSLAERCLLLKLLGRKCVKLKVGRPDDVVRVAIVRETLGAATLRLDANGAWTVPVAIERLKAMSPFGVAAVEQPVAADDLAGMRRVREKSGVPVIADESVCSIDDARRAIAERAADAINVRIGKCGGLVASKEMVAFARSEGLGCTLGTLVGETGILSRAAEIFATRVGGFDCLEGRGQHRFLLQEDVVEPHAEGVGLGLRRREEAIARFAVLPSRTFEHFQGAVS